LDLSAFIIGTILSLLTQVAKKWDVSPRLVVVYFSIIVAVGYMIFQDLVPEASQEWAMVFVRDTMGTATLLYALFGKQMDKAFNIPPKDD